MQIFIVKGTNRPGELATLTGALASQDVNVLITALGVNGQGVAAFVANDEGSAETALKEAGYDYQVFPCLTISLINKPGQVAEVSRKLGDQGVNIQCFLPVGATQGAYHFAVGVDNIEAATKALDQWTVEFTYS